MFFLPIQYIPASRGFPLTKPTKFVKHVIKVFPATLLEYGEHIVLQIGNWVIRLFLQLSVFSGCFSLFSPVFRLFSHLLSKRRTRLQVLWLAHGSKIADEDLVLISSDDIDINCF